MMLKHVAYDVSYDTLHSKLLYARLYDKQQEIPAAFQSQLF